MIQTSVFDEFGLGSNPTTKEKTIAVAKTSAITFSQTAGTTFLVYNTLFSLDNLVKKEQIQWKNNAIESLQIGIKYAAEVTITDTISNSLAISRGHREFYDPIVGGMVAGAAVEFRSGFKGMCKGAVNGGLTQTAFVALSYAMKKLQEK